MSVLDVIYSKAKRNPQKVAFPEAENEKIMQAAYECVTEGYIIPHLVGNVEKLTELAAKRGYELEVFKFVDLNDTAYKEKIIKKYVDLPATILGEKALSRRMNDPLTFALVMEAIGDVDSTFAGIDYTTGDVLYAGQMIVGLKDGITNISSVALCEIPGFNGSEGNLLAIADSAVATNPNAEELANIAISSCDTMKALIDWEPRCAMISYSTLGSGQGELVDKVTEAVKIANEKRPDLCIEGEFQLDAAIVPESAAKKVKTESKVAGKANILVWTNLDVGNVAVKLIQTFGKANAFGPMLQGYRKVICDCSRSAPVSEIKGNIILSAARAIGENRKEGLL